MLTTTPGCRILFLTLVIFGALLGPAQAEEHHEELVPEFNVFIKLNQQIRLFLLGDITQGVSPSTTDGEFGAHLDFTLKPILRRKLRSADWERSRYLWVRAGYVVSGDLDGRDDEITQMMLLEMTGRFELPWEVWLVNRARVDFRDIDGERSQRYRVRVGIEREFTVCRVVMVPYLQAETFYDTRFDTFNRQLYQAGVEIELNKHWRIEPYVARQNDSRSASGNVNRFGLVLKSYF
jgi:hypothetical protein